MHALPIISFCCSGNLFKQPTPSIVMKKKVLVLASTFPRWKNDTTPSFVFDLCKNLSKAYDIYAVAPHYDKANLSEKIENVHVYRFKYAPENMQKIAYGAGIITNVR